ncbi:hairy-related 1 isoform X2 [Trichomycterus rosablanca]|uniref:hairy-related 1 isoform X2 n=1 Tax=Trichomycterus rosablanca TaxID=2290929 RepID=UPI002F35B26C
MTEKRILTMGTPKNPKSRASRRVLKPVIEKKRRDRINQSLDELRTLLLDNTLDSRLQNPKLEKAEILELTVEYIRKKSSKDSTDLNRDLCDPVPTVKTTGVPRVPFINLHDAQNLHAPAPSSPLYTAGFQDCVSRLASFIECVDPSQRENFIQGLRQHLNSHTDTISKVRGHNQASSPQWVRANLHPSPEPFSFSNGLYSGSFALHHPYPSPPYSLSPPPSPCYSSSSPPYSSSPTYLTVPCHFSFPPSISPLSSDSTSSSSSSFSSSFTMSAPAVLAPAASATQAPQQPQTPHCPSQQILRRELFPCQTNAVWRPW